MHKALLYVGLVVSLALPAFASAATITHVTLNGGTSVQVNPADNIVVSVTATLGAKEKWKGTDWGINTTGTTPTCANTKNAHSNEDGHTDWDDDHGRGDQDDRHHDNHTFSELFIAKAPKTPGLYGISVIADAKNNCGQPISAAVTLPQSIRVGTNTVPPTFAPYSDIVVQLTASTTGTTVTYPLPTATDHFGNGLKVSCSPASGSFFAVGNNTVLCNATDAWSNHATPLIFTVSVLLPPDVTPPVILPHGDASVQATSLSGAVVLYGTPAAIDDRDGPVSVSCTPVSGSTFAIGTTTVTCSASDAAGNIGHSTFKIGVYYISPDTVPPVITPHADVVAFLTHAGVTSVAVPYTLPTATDNHDGSVPVACTPVSGSTFNVGSTTVTCSAQDAAGNNATSTTFVVGVYPFTPQSVTIAAQTDESYQCLPNESDGWRACYTGGDNISLLTIPLGQGSGLQAGALTGVTLSLDPNFASSIPANPFRISILCFTDATYTVPCTDWVAGNTHNGNNHSFVFEDTLHTTDNKHWTADFTTFNEHNFDGSSPVVFNSNYYYQLKIEDLGVGWPMNGQDPASVTSSQPYWAISGITQ